MPKLKGSATAQNLSAEAVRDIVRQEYGSREVIRDPGVQAPRGMQVRVRRAQGYYNEIKMEPGRVFKLHGAINDEKLVRLGWLEPYKGDTLACRMCGAEFESENARATHGANVHDPRPTPSMCEVPINKANRRERTTYSAEDIAEERAIQAAASRQAQIEDEDRERRLEQEAPLYMDKTAASQKG